MKSLIEFLNVYSEFSASINDTADALHAVTAGYFEH